MEQVLQNLIIALRGSGMRVSVTETIDAMGAVRLTGYSDRQILKDSLSVTLAKSLREKEIFKTCFDRFFSGDTFSHPEADEDALPDIGLYGEGAPLTRMLLSGDHMGLSMSMRNAAQKIDISGIRFFTQKSLYIQRILKGMGIEGLDQDIRRLSKRDTPSFQQKAQELKNARHLLFENVKNFVEQQFSLFAASVSEEILERYLRHVRLSNVEQQDFHRIHRIIKKMVKRLNDRHSKRRKSSKRGWLDLKKTLRKNVAYQGLIFDPRWKAKKIDRPELVVLCDVSRSVEAVARFMLLFLYGLNEEVAKICSYIFCSNLVKVSHVFKEYTVEEAIVRLQQGIGLGIQFGRTDYGQAFRDFKEKGLDRVGRKSTVIILGDARNNYGDPQADILRIIHERSRRIIWLNPESPSFWGTGDSEMKRYMPYCFLVKECGTVNHLERVVNFLLRTSG